MGKAKDLMDAFWERYPEAKTGKLSLEEINQLLTKFQHKINNSPVEDFDGLSPKQMNQLLYYPLLNESILQFQKLDDATINQVPLFTLAEILLNEIKNKGKIKLTTKGNLPMYICNLLHIQNLIKWEYMEMNKIFNEDVVPYIWPLKQYLLDEGLVKKQNNSLSLTKKGNVYLTVNKEIQFKQLFNYFANKFHWGNFYDTSLSFKCGQLGWAFSLLLVYKYGDKTRETSYYSHWLYKAFGDENLDIENYDRVYSIRFFEYFCTWFGLIQYEIIKNKNPYMYNICLVTKTKLFEKLFIL